MHGNGDSSQRNAFNEGDTDVRNGDVLIEHKNERPATERIGEKAYKCDVCAATFTWKNDLKKHMKIHIGEKPYKCDLCAATFTQNGSLKTHMIIHTGQKPYKCEFCKATFTMNGCLKAHMRIHRREALQV